AAAAEPMCCGATAQPRQQEAADGGHAPQQLSRASVGPAGRGASAKEKIGSLVVALLGLGVVLVLPVVVRWLTKDPVEEIAYGLTAVVIAGAAGFLLRGIGELYAGPGLKASGYFLGAVAYG